MSTKRTSKDLERRTYELLSLTIETREENQSRAIVGHAAVFDTIGDGGWFREKIAPGAFKSSLKKDDVRALFNHDPNFVLGRNKAGTLSMKEDDKGLWVEIDPPDTQYARDLMTSIERGDINQMSFAFEIIKESRENSESKTEPPTFTLEEVKLWDVSPVTYPFYKETDVSVNSRSAWAEQPQRSDRRKMKWRRLQRKEKLYNKEVNR